MKKQVCLIAWYCTLGVSLPACDEQLPVRIDPTIPLRGTVDAVYFGAADSGYGATQNVLDIYFDVTYPRGSFDETLQGEAEMTANLDIVWILHPNYRAHIVLGKKQVVENRKYKYNIETNILTMDPGDQISFFCDWNFRDDNGIFLPDLFPLVTDSACVRKDTVRTPDSVYVVKSYPRKIAGATFEISGTAKMFTQFAVCYISPRQFSIVWENKHRCR